DQGVGPSGGIGAARLRTYAAQSDRVDSGRCHKHRPLGADRSEIAGAHAAVGHAARDHRAAASPIVRLRRLPGDPERGNRTDPVSLYPTWLHGRRGWTRTSDPQLRRLMLYPPELRARIFSDLREFPTR